jgi:hypothetical protein
MYEFDMNLQEENNCSITACRDEGVGKPAPAHHSPHLLLFPGDSQRDKKCLKINHSQPFFEGWLMFNHWIICD